jgi:hypothetical protein
MAKKKIEDTVPEGFVPSDTHERALLLTMGQSVPVEAAEDEATEATPAEADTNPKDGSDGEE